MSAAVLMEVAEASDAIDFDADPEQLLNQLMRTALTLMADPSPKGARSVMVQIAAIAVRFVGVIDSMDDEDGAT